jgi:hypothetical protein
MISFSYPIKFCFIRFKKCYNLKFCFNFRYEFIVSDLVRRKLRPGDGLDSDEHDDNDDDSTVKYIIDWHANRPNKTVVSVTTSPSESTTTTTLRPFSEPAAPVTSGGASAPRKNASSPLQFRPEYTPHMDTMGKHPEYYPQVFFLTSWIWLREKK